MATIKLKFRPSTVSHKEGIIYYQLIHKQSVRQIRTGYKIFPYEWESVLGGILIAAGADASRRSYLAMLKSRMDTDLRRLRSCICMLEKKKTSFTVQQILELYVAPGEEYGFLLYGKMLLDELRKIGKWRTADTYSKALCSLEHYLGEQADIPLSEMDSYAMVGYESWLKGNGLCPNSTSYYMRNLRAIYNRAVEQGLVQQQYPFKQVYTGVEKTRKRAVSLHVIRDIRDVKLEKESQIWARDLFMFSFYTRGMSFVDMVFLKKKDLQNGILSYRRNKTGQRLYIKWEKPMQDILDRYDTADTPYLLPIIQNNGIDEWKQYHNEVHRINRNLKTVGQLIGLSVPLTTYVARHAWASIAQSKNIALSVISEALGHDSEQTTRIYLASLDTAVVDKANLQILMSL